MTTTARALSSVTKKKNNTIGRNLCLFNIELETTVNIKIYIVINPHWSRVFHEDSYILTILHYDNRIDVSLLPTCESLTTEVYTIESSFRSVWNGGEDKSYRIRGLYGGYLRCSSSSWSNTIWELHMIPITILSFTET